MEDKVKIEQVLSEKITFLPSDVPASNESNITEYQVRQADPNAVESRLQIIKKLATVGYPMSIGNGLKVMESFILSNFLAEAGGNALAVEALFDLYMGFLSASTASFVTTIPTIMIGEAYGSGNKVEVGRIVRQAWVLAGAISIPVIIGLSSAEPILISLGQPPELIDAVGNYARVLYFGTPALLGLIVDINFLKTISKQHLLVPLQGISCGLGLGICYVLVLGKMGFEPKGAVGIGYALTIQSWISWLICKIYFRFSNDIRAYRLFDFSFQNFQHIKRMLRNGLPLFVLSLSDQGLIFTTGIMIGRLGTRNIKINQAMGIFLKLINIPADGIRQATQIFVSQHMGKKRYLEMRHFQRTGILLFTSINILPLVFFTTIPYQLTNFFVRDENLEDIESFLRIVFFTRALTNIAEACRGSISDNLCTLFDTYYPMIVQILTTLFLILPLSYLMAFSLDLDLIGLNIASLGGAAVSIPILLRRLSSTNHRMMLENSIFPARPSQFSDALLSDSKRNITNEQLSLSLEVEPDQLRFQAPSVEIKSLSTSDESSESDLKNRENIDSVTQISQLHQIQNRFVEMAAHSQESAPSILELPADESTQNIVLFSGTTTIKSTSEGINDKLIAKQR